LVISVFAAIGGIIVYMGLKMEGPPDEKPFKDVGEFRRHKIMGARGWKWLMRGVFIEIVVAMVFAWRDGCQARQTAIAIAANDPRNQPVETAFASATVLLRQDPAIHFSESDLWLALPADFLHATNAIQTIGGNTKVPDPKIRLHCSNFRQIPSNRGTIIWIEFAKGGPMNDEPFPQIALGEMGDWNDALIWLPYSGEADVLDGSITLTLNTSSKIFKIPAQKLVDHRPIQVFEGTNSSSK
jgi:hypothetical protein